MIINGSPNMYQTRRIVDKEISVELPTCMYKMRNLHGATRSDEVIKRPNHVHVEGRHLDISQQVKQFLQNCQEIPGMAELLQRQQNILQQLDELKGQMVNIRKILNVSPNTATSSVPKKSSMPVHLAANESIDIVIHANPQYPPYCLIVLSKVLKDKVNVNVCSHVHSSIKSNESVRAFTIPGCIKSEMPDLKIRVIWKDVGAHLVMITSDGLQVIGEVNMLRYLGRRIPYLNYEGLTVLEQDSILDTCHLIISASTKIERSSLLKLISNRFSQIVSNKEQSSIINLAIYSTLKKLNQNELNVGMNKILTYYDSL